MGAKLKVRHRTEAKQGEGAKLKVRQCRFIKLSIYIHTKAYLALFQKSVIKKKLILQVKKDEDFCKLEWKSKLEDFKPAKKIRILLNIFHTEVTTCVYRNK